MHPEDAAEVALEIGTQNAVVSTSRSDGYLGDPLIRVGLPGGFGEMATASRSVG